MRWLEKKESAAKYFVKSGKQMSRIGKQPITIPGGVTVTVEDGGRFGYKVVRVR